MGGIASTGDLSTGHDCFPPAAIAFPVVGSVFCNGKPVAIDGQLTVPHMCGTPHPGVVVSTNLTVFTGGVSIVRVGDLVKCDWVEEKQVELPQPDMPDQQTLFLFYGFPLPEDLEIEDIDPPEPEIVTTFVPMSATSYIMTGSINVFIGG